MGGGTGGGGGPQAWAPLQRGLRCGSACGGAADAPVLHRPFPNARPEASGLPHGPARRPSPPHVAGPHHNPRASATEPSPPLPHFRPGDGTSTASMGRRPCPRTRSPPSRGCRALSWTGPGGAGPAPRSPWPSYGRAFGRTPAALSAGVRWGTPALDPHNTWPPGDMGAGACRAFLKGGGPGGGGGLWGGTPLPRRRP